MSANFHQNKLRNQLRTALCAGDLPLGELWLGYFSLGGNLDEFAIDSYIHGFGDLPEEDLSLLGEACSQFFGGPPYRDG